MKVAGLIGALALAIAASSIDDLPSPAGIGAAEPSLAVGRNGEVHLSWLEPLDSGFALKTALLTGNKWSAPVTIRSGRDFWLNWADFPSVAVLADGRLAAHWLQRTGKPTYAYAVRVSQSADNGRTWSAAVTPHRDTQLVEHGFVAMWPEGKGLGAAWLDGRKTGGGHEGHGEMSLMATTIGPDGHVAAEQVIDARTCDCCQNAVAVAADGPVIAYRNRTADEIRDIHVARRVNGKWLEGTPVHADNWKINACPVNGPAIKASGNSVAVAWFTGARDTNRVNVAFSSNGGAAFGKAIRVDGGEPGGRVDLALLKDGSVVVSWLERTGGTAAEVRARRVTPDGTLGAVKTIATSTSARASGVPRMVLSGDDLYFAWTVASKPTSVRLARASVSEFR
jgi:hypothetical protein